MDSWRLAAGHKLGRRAALHAAVTHFVKGAMAKAFASWSEWALRRAGQQRKARAYLSLLAGRHQGWAFAMLRWAGSAAGALLWRPAVAKRQRC